MLVTLRGNPDRVHFELHIVWDPERCDLADLEVELEESEQHRDGVRPPACTRRDRAPRPRGQEQGNPHPPDPRSGTTSRRAVTTAPVTSRHQRAEPDGRDDWITFTAKAPDGSGSSTNSFTIGTRGSLHSENGSASSTLPRMSTGSRFRPDSPDASSRTPPPRPPLSKRSSDSHERTPRARPLLRSGPDRLAAVQRHPDARPRVTGSKAKPPTPSLQRM